ncbi:hypothetical protein [Ruminococcus sp.]|uniref:hypothetical protein n=1 Tax=Ruminococcus sp. TaxID=41978 RepID=UPI0025DAB023|nr:hypothetical protein [Ruminococcus sp.]
MDLIRKLSAEERATALDLAWRVFSEYESPDYSKEGTLEFKKCLHDEKYLAGIEYYGAFDRERLIGLVGIRSDRKHISCQFCCLASLRTIILCSISCKIKRFRII